MEVVNGGVGRDGKVAPARTALSCLANEVKQRISMSCMDLLGLRFEFGCFCWPSGDGVHHIVGKTVCILGCMLRCDTKNKNGENGESGSRCWHQSG